MQDVERQLVVSRRTWNPIGRLAGRGPVALSAALLALGGGGIGAALAASGNASSQAARSVSGAAAGTSSSAAHIASTTGAPTGAASAATSGQRTGLVRTGNALPGLSHATLLGNTPGSDKLTIDVGLAQPDSAGEQALLSAISTPGNAQYHRFLTPAQFDARFGVPAATVAATKAWLRSGGLTVGYVSPSGDLVSARGTTSQIGALMGTSFGTYRVGTVQFVANQSPPAVPAALPITTVVGLNTLQRMYTQPQLAKANGATATTPASSTSATTSYTGALVAQDLWNVYDASPCSGTTCQTSTTVDAGQGETAGMFGDGYTPGVIENLRVFEQRMGLPQVPVRVVQEGSLPGGTPNDNDVVAEVEWDLDTQAITGMAPGLSQLNMYFASSLFDPDTGVMFDAWSNDPAGPKQMNASFGECNADPTSPYDGSLPATTFGEGLVGNQLQVLSDPALEQSNLEGRTLFASAGDSGGSCPAVVLPVLSAGNGVIPQPAPVDQNYPCDSAYVTCVGGTVVTTDGTTNPGASSNPQPAPSTQTNYNADPKRVSEQAWAYTGGGSSDNVPEPAFQKGVAAVNEPCTMPVDPKAKVITPGTICRGVPDVAAMSGSGLPDGFLLGNNGYVTNIDMFPIPVGGTSLSSPLTVGMWSRIQAAARTTAGLGFAADTIYAVGKGSLGNAARDFYDITQNELPTGNFYHLAGKGWDYASGWGALDVNNFIKDVDGDTSLAPTHPSYSTVGTPANVCAAPLTLSSPQGNAYDVTLSPTAPLTSDPQLDITTASLALSSDGKSLVATIGGPDLSTTGPPDATSGYNFQLDWTYQGTTYFAGASVNYPQQLPSTGVPNNPVFGPIPITNSVPAPASPPTGTVTYGDGTASDLGVFTNIDSGSFKNGTFTIVVPLANVGNPGTGAVLQYPFAYDTLPDGVLVALATDEAATEPPGLQYVFGSTC
ncbi:MAG TPA: protease pro-enzyme activation domain-containing protein [Acidimicrobiales bacterium]|nr:protease pro-enzyme activation domain-containing protein [Acidimicrobiales bacterium]